MACFALARRWAIKQDIFAVYRLVELMALDASDGLMRPLQGKCCARVVVEFRGLPPRRSVAARAIRNVAPRSKLPAMGIFVATRTPRRSGVKIRITQGGLEIRRMVAIAARHPSVCSQQGEARLGMVKLAQFLPTGGVVAGFAAGCRSVRAFCVHAISELSLVRVFMAGCAGSVFVSKSHRNRRTGRRRLMAVCASDREVRTGQRKPGRLVFRKAEMRGSESLYVVALFAAIQMRRGGKLALVDVIVTILAPG